MANLSPVALVRGTIRVAMPLTRRGENGQPGPVFGTRLTLLTEPSGGFIDVTAFNNTLAEHEATALEGATVELRVSLAARSWRTRGGDAGASLDAVLQEVVAVHEAPTVEPVPA